MLELPNYFLTQILLRLFDFILGVFGKDLHEAQRIEKVFRKFILVAVSEHPEQHMEILFAVEWRLGKHTPHLVTDSFNLAWFRTFSQFYHVPQCNDQMLLEVVKTRLLSLLSNYRILLVLIAAHRSLLGNFVFSASNMLWFWTLVERRTLWTLRI